MTGPYVNRYITDVVFFFFLFHNLYLYVIHCNSFYHITHLSKILAAIWWKSTYHLREKVCILEQTVVVISLTVICFSKKKKSFIVIWFSQQKKKSTWLKNRMKKFSGENLEEYSVMIDESHIFQILNSINNQNKIFFFSFYHALISALITILYG